MKIFSKTKISRIFTRKSNSNKNLLKIKFIFFLFFILINIKKKSHKKINLNISNYINIAVNFDNKYIYTFVTFLTSLLEHRADSTFYIIHTLIENNLKNDTYQKVNSVIEKFGKNYSNISYYTMGNQFSRATSGKYIVDKCIYMDTDVINFKDLSEMYNIQLNDSEYFCGILDFADMKEELKSLRIDTDKYMNAGIAIMNLKAMRNNSIEQKLRGYVSSHFLNHHDQTAINAICHNNFKILPFKFAMLTLFDSTESLIKYNNQQKEKYRYNESELIQAFYHPTSIHYAGWVKPYEKKYKLANGAYWWYYAKKSGFYQEILDNYGFTKEEVEDILKKIPSDGGFMKKIL